MFAEDEARLLGDAASGPELDALVQRRVGGEPLEHVLGWASFDGQRVTVGPGVFVPRRRTEHLARLAAGLLRELDEPAVVVDLCCGAAPIALSLLATDRRMELYATDADPVAVVYARQNLGGRAHVSTGDLFEALPAALRGRIDLLTVNTPYVPTGEIASMPSEARDHEPRLALDGGADGLDVQRRVAAGAARWLAPGGHVLVEVGRAQAARSVELFRSAGLKAWVEIDDSIGATVVTARRTPSRAT